MYKEIELDRDHRERQREIEGNRERQRERQRETERGLKYFSQNKTGKKYNGKRKIYGQEKSEKLEGRKRKELSVSGPGLSTSSGNPQPYRD